MANTLLTPSMVTRQAIELYRNSNALIMNVDRQFDDEFGRKGGKIGNTLKIRLPNDYTVTTGPALNTQETQEVSTALTVATQKHVDVAFTTAERTMSLDDFSERILAPAVNNLAGAVAADLMSGAEAGICNYRSLVDGSNNTLSPTRQTFLNARASLLSNSTPLGNWLAVTSPQTNAKIVGDLSGLFNPSQRISQQYMDGTVMNALGFDWVTDQTVLVHTTGTFSSGGAVNGAGQTGTNLVVGAITGTLKKGDIITIAGVNAINRVTKADTGELRQFTVTADVASGSTLIPIYPAIIPAGNAYATVTVSPANSAAVSLVHKASEQTRKNFVMSPKAVTMAYGELEIPKSVKEASVVTEYDISMRFMEVYIPQTDQTVHRLDVLYGYTWVRPEWACIVADSLT